FRLLPEPRPQPRHNNGIAVPWQKLEGILLPPIPSPHRNSVRRSVPNPKAGARERVAGESCTYRQARPNALQFEERLRSHRSSGATTSHSEVRTPDYEDV